MAKLLQFKKRDDLMTEIGIATCRVLDLQSEYACLLWTASMTVMAATVVTGLQQVNSFSYRPLTTGTVVHPEVVPFR